MLRRAYYLVVLILLNTAWTLFPQNFQDDSDFSNFNVEQKVEILNSFNDKDAVVLPFVYNGYLYSFSLSRSIPLWRFFLGGDLENPFVVYNGRIFVYDIYNRIYAIDLKSGKILWSYNSDGELVGKPQVYKNYIVVILNATDVVAIDLEDGSIVLKETFNRELVNGIVFKGDEAFLAYKEGTVEAFDIHSRKALWQFSASGIMNVPPVLDGSILFFGTWDDNFYAVDGDNGSLKWISYVGSPINREFLVFNNSIVIFLSNGEIVSLRKSDGSIEWVKYFRDLDFDYNYFKDKNKLYIIEPELKSYDPDSGNLVFTYRQRVFKLYKEMLFESMVEGKHFIGEKERERLLKERYFVLNSFPILPIIREENYIYFIGEDDNLYVYDLQKDFFILKYSLNRG